MIPFTVHTLESAPEESRHQLAVVVETWGFMPNLHGILAESPQTLEACETLMDLVSRSSFTPAEQQAAYLAVNVLHGCEYCTAGHTYLARQAQLDEGAVQSLRKGETISDRRLEALRHFVETVVRARGAVGDDAVEAFLAAGFTQRHVLEVVLIVATKTISNYVNHIVQTPRESFMADPNLGWVAPRNRVYAA